MSGAEAIYVPLLLGATVGAGCAAARGGSASNIALSGLAGAGTGGFGGRMAAPAAGATGTGAGTAAGRSAFGDVGPLTSYGAAVPATLGTGTAAGALGSNLGTSTVGPLLSEYATGVAPAAASSGWGNVGGMKGLVKTGIESGLQGQQWGFPRDGLCTPRAHTRGRV